MVSAAFYIRPLKPTHSMDRKWMSVPVVDEAFKCTLLPTWQSYFTVPEHTSNKALGRGSHARGPGMQGTASHSNRSGGFGMLSRGNLRVPQYCMYIDN